MENNKKHAYLIMAHNNFNQLKKLLELLDYEKNDIYMHIDKKSKFDKNELVKDIKKSKVYFTERINVKWGSYRQIEAELILLKEATQKNYLYYHLLSGYDLPIKSNDEIFDFFEKNNGKQFIHFKNENDYDDIENRIKYYYLCTDFRKSKGIKKILKYAIFKSLLVTEKIFNINRIKKLNLTIKSGANWFSITNELAKYVVKNEEIIRKTYKRTFCADEIFLQTIVYNNKKFRDELYYQGYDDNYKACMRYILWKNKKPHIWEKQDYNELINSDYLFARKFNENIDNDIINKIYERLKNKKLNV